MTAVGHVVKTMRVTIPTPPGSTPIDYECAVTGVDLTPTRTTQTSTTACPDGVVVDVGPATYELTIGLNVDMKAGSLYRLLVDHDGTAATVSVEFDPVGAPGVVTNCDVTLLDPGHSAQVGSFHTTSATLPVRGKPRIVDPAPASADAPE